MVVFADEKNMTVQFRILKKVIVFVFSFSFLFLAACGESPNSVDGIDELESAAPDEGLNEDLSPDEPKACLGKVVTESSNLNIRTSPEISDNICDSIASQSYVTLLSLEPENGFYSVKTDLCEEEEFQFVSASFIELSDDCFPQEDEEDDDDTDPNPEPQILDDLGQYIEENLKFVSVVRELVRGGAKGRVEVFQLPGQGENLMCGIKHIRSYRSEAFQGKDTLCSWTAVAQEWQQKHCPDNAPHCRIMMGDASFGERMPSSWPHSTHRRGWCMDIWPMRDQGCGEKEVTWKQSCYNRDMTKDFVKLLIKHGADKGNQLFFNDPQIPDVRYLSNHDDHIHVCFKPSNGTVQQKCNSTKVDSRFCPEFFE